MDEAAEPAGLLEELDARGNDAQGLQNTELSSRRLKKLQDAQRQRGIIYINRIPPHMKPHKIRYLLSRYGKLGRIYLAPEDKAVRTRRKKSGKDTGKNFSEGWVEFEDKREAKQVALMLNSNPIGGKRRSGHHDDLWCLKYLPKFKWDHLTEEMAYQSAVREQRLAQEISAANRERDFYMSRVNAAKGIAAQAERKRKRAEQQTPSAGPSSRAADESPASTETATHRSAHAGSNAEGSQGGRNDGKHDQSRAKPLRSYGQRRAKADPVSDGAAPALQTRTLALLAGKG